MFVARCRLPLGPAGVESGRGVGTATPTSGKRHITPGEAAPAVQKQPARLSPPEGNECMLCCPKRAHHCGGKQRAGAGSGGEFRVCRVVQGVAASCASRPAAPKEPETNTNNKTGGSSPWVWVPEGLDEPSPCAAGARGLASNGLDEPAPPPNKARLAESQAIVGTPPSAQTRTQQPA